MRHGRLLVLVFLAILALAWLSSSDAPANDDDPLTDKLVQKDRKNPEPDRALIDKVVAKDHAEAAKDHAGSKEASGPQIFTPVRIDLAIWTLVVFLLLLAVLSKYAWNPMLGALQKREENIHSALDEAKRAREEAQSLRETLAKDRAEIAQERRIAMDEARKDAQQLRDSMEAQAKAVIQAERDRLHREMESAKDGALKQLWEQAAQLATLISAKAIRRELTVDDHRRLVDDALADLRKAGESRKG